MTNEVNNEIKGNKGCNITVNTYLAPNDKLAKYNIIEEELRNKKKIEQEFSERIGYAEKVYSEQLPKELQNDFEIKSEKIGKSIEFITKPKTDDAYKKFPPRITFSYNITSVKGLEKFKSKNFRDLTREMYEKQEGIIIENPYNIKEFLGDIENPASIFSNMDSNATSTIYIKPEPFPPARGYNIKLFNNYFEFELQNIMLRIEKIEDNVYILSNKESINDKFDIKFKIEHDKQKVKFNLGVNIKERFNTDAEVIYEFIKYDILIHDIDSYISIEFSENNKKIVNIQQFGKKKFGKKEYKEVRKEFNFLEKVIFIEKRKNIKLKYNTELLKYKPIIYMLYNEVQGKNYTFTNESTWILYGNDNQFDIKEIKKIYNEKIKIPIETKFNELSIGGEEIKLKEHKIVMKDCRIISIEEKKDIYYIKVTTSNAKFQIIQ